LGELYDRHVGKGEQHNLHMIGNFLHVDQLDHIYQIN